MKNLVIRTLSLFILLVSSFQLTNAQINTDRVLAIGKNALYFEDYILSIQYFNQVIKSKPYLAEPYLYRGLAKFNLDDFVGSEKDMTSCVEINPFLTFAYQCRGAARQNSGNYTGAIEDYDKVMETNPNDKLLLLNKAIAYLQLDDKTSAMQTLTQLVETNPSFTQGYLERGTVAVEMGDTVQGFDDFNKALELDKYYPQVYSRRGLLYLQQGEYEKALDDLDQAIYLEPNKDYNYINRGLARYYVKNLRGAMTDYDAVIDLNDKNLIARFNRALLRSEVGDVMGAIEDLNKVIQLEPDNYMAIYNRALLHYETKQYSQVLPDLEVIIAEYPNFVPAYYFRSEVRRSMNDTKNADIDYWAAFDLEEKLNKLKAQGKIITGKEILDAHDPKVQEMADSQTRKKANKDIENYDKMISSDSNNEETAYSDPIRGKVQNQQVSLEIESAFVISYYNQPTEITQSRKNSKYITDFNNKRFIDKQLFLVNNEMALTDQQAEQHFESINRHSRTIDANPSDAYAYFARAMDFMLLQDLSEAITDYGRSVTYDPKFLPAYFNRAVTRYKQLLLNEYRLDSYDGSSMYVDMQTGEAQRVETNTSNPYYNDPVSNEKLSKEQKRRMELELIYRDYEQVIALDPDFVFAYFNRANMYFSQRDFRSALTDYNEAIKRNANFAEAYYNRGLTHLYLKEDKKGIEDLSKAGELGIVRAYSLIKKMTTD